jgi:hypothetical protein
VGCLFLFLFSFFLSVLSTSPSLSSHPYSHPLHSPYLSCATIHCCPSQLLFLPLLTHSPPAFTSSSSSQPPPTCHQTTLLSYTLTICSLTSCINFTQPQHPEIPDTRAYTTTETHPNTHKDCETSTPHFTPPTPHFSSHLLLPP